MTKNPFVNALGASAYIAIVGFVMSTITHTQRNKPDTFMAPITVMSVLTLSVAVMAFIFFYQPIQLFISGKKKEGLKLFTQTVGIFGAMTAIVLILLFLGL